MNTDGKMDKKEFSIAMHLIKKKLQGYELPKTLPASLKADPSVMVNSYGMAQNINQQMTMPMAMTSGMYHFHLMLFFLNIFAFYQLKRKPLKINSKHEKVLQNSFCF